MPRSGGGVMKLKVTALSPMHFSGSPFDVSRLEYAFLNNRLYVLSEQALLSAVAEKGVADEFTEWLGLPAEQQDLSSFLRRHGLLSTAGMDTLAKYDMPCRVPPEGDVRPLPRGVDGRPYLPASAFKGALRVAVAYGLVKAMPDERRRDLIYGFVADELERFRRHPLARDPDGWFRERVKQTFASRIDHGLFQRFRLSPQEGQSGPNTDVLRTVRVSDSASVDAGAVSVCPVRVYSAGSHGAPKPWHVLAECIWVSTTFELELKIDEALLSEFERYNKDTGYGVPFAKVAELVRDPLAALAVMTQDLYGLEQAFHAEALGMPQALDLRGKEPNMRLGWGTTMLGTSVSMLLPDELRAELRNTLLDNRGSSFAPKSRKLVEMGANAYSMGWARVEAAV